MGDSQVADELVAGGPDARRGGELFGQGAPHVALVAVEQGERNGDAHVEGVLVGPLEPPIEEVQADVGNSLTRPLSSFSVHTRMETSTSTRLR